MPAHTLILHHSGASDRGSATETLEFDSREQVADYLESLVRKPDGDRARPHRLTFKTTGETIEFSGEGGRLFYSLQGNLNQQNIPLSVSQAVDRICGPDASGPDESGSEPDGLREKPPPRSTHRRKTAGPGGPLLAGALLLVTLTVQGFVFLDGSPSVYREAKLSPIPPERGAQLTRRYAGDYATDSPAVGLGLRLTTDGTFAIFSWNPTDPENAEIKRKGAYDFAREGDTTVIRLIGEGVVDISGENTLNFYGYPLTGENPIPKTNK